MGARWYAVALLTAPLLMATTLFVLSRTSPAFLPGIASSEDKASLLCLALAEAATLLGAAGRFCENGKPVPTERADWASFAEGLRHGGMASFKAAQSKNQDAMLEAADRLVTACANCHDVYRDKSALGGTIAARCVK